MPKYHIDATSFPYLYADAWTPGRKARCGRDAPRERLLSFKDFRRRVQAEGAADLCHHCGNKRLPIL